MIFCGDLRQTDLRFKKDSGISFFTKLECETPDDVQVISLKKNHRHAAVERVLKVYEDYQD
jgi:phosphate starvation-inducible protein PhoH